MNTFICKTQISEKLGISPATVNNWIKTGVIPLPDVHGYYSQSVFESIVNTIKNDSARLNSRANRALQKKRYLCYLGITDKDRRKLLVDLVNRFEKSDLTVSEGVLAVAFTILRSNGLIGVTRKTGSGTRLERHLSEWETEISARKTIKTFFADYEIPNFNDDILGAFYQSIQNISQRSNLGSFYTPPELLDGIKIPASATVYDPCCGSGGILLNILTPKHDPSKVFASDIDEIALKICFVNLALFFGNADIALNISRRDITFDDLFSSQNDEQYDYIVTNPPWGSKFTVREKKRLCESYPELATSEIFSISLYNALKMLKRKGELCFYLPHSFLNVASHRNIRRFIFNKNRDVHIKLLGRAFNGVLSESILLRLKKSSGSQNITVQNQNDGIYKIPLCGIVPPDYIVSATNTNKDSPIIDKIYKTEHITLAQNTIFALGIVTGNNVKYLTTEKKRQSEAIFRGKDIEKYMFLNPKYFLEFQPDRYQQIAPVEYYRREKIAYRFIGDRLVCVLDRKNHLLLNSANLLISNNYPMETIVSFFNSDIYTFIFRKKFHSKKILKSHLQNLPLPVLSDDTHKLIRELYNDTFTKKNMCVSAFQKKIDAIICDTFSIDNKQFNHIKNEVLHGDT